MHTHVSRLACTSLHRTPPIYVSCSAIRLRSEGAGQISTGEKHQELTYLALASATMASAVLDTETYTDKAPSLISATADETASAVIQYTYFLSLYRRKKRPGIAPRAPRRGTKLAD